MKLIFLIFLFTFTLAKYGTLSLYHVSGTSFINLKKFSEPFSFELKYFSTFENETHISQDILDKSIGLLRPKEVIPYENYGILLKDSKLGDIVIFPGKIQGKTFLKSPNGKRQYQSWIYSESDYLTLEQENGDVPLLTNWIGELEKLSFLKIYFYVNVQLPCDSSLLRNLMVNIYREENRKDIVKESNVKILSNYTTGFIEKLLEVDQGKLTYNPSMDELYDDFIIRQIAENLTESEFVWREDITRLRKIVLDSQFDYPNFGFDITPILLEYRPNDEITIKLNKMGLESSNSVQFREFIGNIDLCINRAVGLVKVTQLYGPIVSDSAVSQICHVNLNSIIKIRQYLLQEKPIIFKYIVRDPERCPEMHKASNMKLEEWYDSQQVILGYIDTGFYGQTPLFIPEATVWHQRTEHRFNIMGKFNPGLINFNIAHALENKWFEYLYWNHYCPNSFLPKTNLLLNLLPKGIERFGLSPELVEKILKQNFPQGYVVKGVWDYCSMDHLISQNTNMTDLVYKYRNSSFEMVVERKKQNLLGCEPVEDLKESLRHYKHFKAWKIDLLLKDASETFIQEYFEIEREHRVECAGGYCPISRIGDDDVRGVNDTEKMRDFYNRKIHEHFTKCVYYLPQKLRGTPLSSDVAYLKNKIVITFETNPGGNSWFIHNSIEIAGPHNDFLKNYSYIVTRDSPDKRYHDGMTPEVQIQFLKRMFSLWNVDLKVLAPRFTLLRDRIINDQVYPREIKLERMNYTGPQIFSIKQASQEQISTSLFKSLLYIEKNFDQLLNDKKNSFSLLKLLSILSFRKSGFNQKNLKRFNRLLEMLDQNSKGIIENQVQNIQKIKQEKGLTKVFFEKVQILYYLQVLNIPNIEFRDGVNIIYQNWITQLKNSWKFKFKINRFNPFNRIGFLNALKQMTNSNTRISGLEYLNDWLSSYQSLILPLHAMENLGYDFPLKLNDLFEISHSNIRKLIQYYIIDTQLIKKDRLYRRSFKLLTLSVINTIYSQSNYGLFKLNPNNYEIEISFLKKSIKVSELLEYNVLLGKSIDCLFILNSQILLPKYHFFMVYRQKKDGSWLYDGEEEGDEDEKGNVKLEGSINGISIFTLESYYSNLEILESTSENISKKMNQLKLFQNHIEIQKYENHKELYEKYQEFKKLN